MCSRSGESESGTRRAPPRSPCTAPQTAGSFREARGYTQQTGQDLTGDTVIRLGVRVLQPTNHGTSSSGKQTTAALRLRRPRTAPATRRISINGQYSAHSSGESPCTTHSPDGRGGRADGDMSISRHSTASSSRLNSERPTRAQRLRSLSGRTLIDFARELARTRLARPRWNLRLLHRRRRAPAVKCQRPSSKYRKPPVPAPDCKAYLPAVAANR